MDKIPAVNEYLPGGYYAEGYLTEEATHGQPLN
jgi:hypothetical protein